MQIVAIMSGWLLVDWLVMHGCLLDGNNHNWLAMFVEDSSMNWLAMLVEDSSMNLLLVLMTMVLLHLVV